MRSAKFCRSHWATAAMSVIKRRPVGVVVVKDCGRRLDADAMTLAQSNDVIEQVVQQFIDRLPSAVKAKLGT
jgi:transcription elongation factor Elf1